MYFIIGKADCPYCEKAKALLEDKGVMYVYVDVQTGSDVANAVWKHFLVEDLGARTVPQVFKLVEGGYEGLLLEEL